MKSLNSSSRPTSITKEEEESFLDAFDELPSPDCFLCDLQPDRSTVSDPQPVTQKPIDPPEPLSPISTLRRRRTYDSETKDLNAESSALSRARLYRLQRKLNDKDQLDSSHGHKTSVGSEAEKEEEEESTVTTAIDDGLVQGSAQSPEFGQSSSSWLELIAGLVIKAIGFQITLMFTFLTFPFSLLYKVYVFVKDPFGAMRFCRTYVMRKSLGVWNLISGSVGSLVSDWLIEHKSIWDLLVRYGLGLLWSAYVWFLLCGFLVSSFLVSGILMRHLVEEPLHMKESLNFDYTKNSPAAFVAVTSCAAAGCGLKCREILEVQKGGGFHSLSQKLRASVTLALPESEYNRKLGMFQVRVDFLSSDGTVLSSSSQPCMLQFKSEHIHLVLTFLKAVPLLACYLSESQTLNLKFKGFTEGGVPTACVKVVVEQRAEYRRGAGIPELYDASITLESELPVFRRIIWYWKKTVFIWISIILFLMELLLAATCCRPLIIPRSRTRDA